MDAIAVLKKYGLDNVSSVHTVIRNIGDVIDESPNVLRACNRVIAEFGGKPVDNHVDAGIIARCLVEQAHLLRDSYNAEQAYQYSLDKVKKITNRLPCLYASVDTSSAESKTVNATSTACHSIFLNHSTEKNIVIAKMIAEQVGITIANANYYVSKFRKEAK